MRLLVILEDEAVGWRARHPTDRPAVPSFQTKTVTNTTSAKATAKTKPKTAARLSSLRRSPVTNSVGKREDRNASVVGVIAISQKSAT